MIFASDNTGPTHPNVLQAVVEANAGHTTPYGADHLMEQVTQRLRDVFEAPQAAIYLVSTGTAANAITLACQTQPYQTVFCSDVAHIHEDECGAPEFFTGGAKLTLIPNDDGKMTPAGLRTAIEGEENRGVHGLQRGPVSITQATEKGTVYTLDEIRAITDIAREYALPTQMDGARFANALVTLGCTPAEMTWRAGIDAVSFGGTKNGLMGVEAVILLDSEKAWEFELRRKRAGHLISKHRYMSAQMGAYLKDDLWLDMARAANTACNSLTRGLKQNPDVTLHFEPRANIIFAAWPRAIHRKLHDAGAYYYILDGGLDGPGDAPLTARLVCDWSADEAKVSAFLAKMTA
ncbi:low specificity L-threonine aldolase [Actibacterium sp. 188UL27-1]|uniref:threonine aldolase family protein n=1 Tax=Actibacterium sp. 188UL27-1 TaxID=2786961 RepID=UPI001956A8BE|nr:beta-eliminating lyase-related protein [Actibacterium sp. 188UL27-1]MBM7066098.1 low specificity L-threonine aldolase [Actibacterium sp. 188UL27-1]